LRRQHWDKDANNQQALRKAINALRDKGTLQSEALLGFMRLAPGLRQTIRTLEDDLGDYVDDDLQFPRLEAEAKTLEATVRDLGPFKTNLSHGLRARAVARVHPSRAWQERTWKACARRSSSFGAS
jgi:hypothetical protein